jgi:hypothetical protein
MRMDQPPAAEAIQYAGQKLRARVTLESAFANHVVQQDIPPSGILAPEHSGDRRVDFFDRATILWIERGIGVDQQVVADAQHGWQALQPRLVSWLDSVEITQQAPEAMPVPMEGVLRIVPQRVTEASGGEQLDLMVAEQHVDLPSAVNRLALQIHQQVQNANAVLAAIDHVAEDHQDAVAAGPAIAGIDQRRVLQEAP